ncbi:sulfite efflux pump SSU1-like protein [Phanerochaete sordida]|uniref:Sulfite efflux pump SSU1-like protein n=1 Tax=Phanerochaete sordida TaxID=48140 RepID=A0A9P3GDD5_9APHY|nr:sulfite efflux pump SSU1-like protein [Phanerochaete sordida]
MEAKEVEHIEAALPYIPPLSAPQPTPAAGTALWRERIHNFSWQWHVVVMATGVCSSLLHNFPYQDGTGAFKVAALSLFLFDLVLFVMLCVWAVARCTMFPKDRVLMLTDPATSLFIGFFTNGAASLINAALSVNRDWGTGDKVLLYTLWGLWWLDSVLACMVAFGLIYLMLGEQSNDLSKLRPSWMVPVITLITMSASGGLFARSLQAHSHVLALLSVSVSAAMLAIGLSFTMMLTTAFLLRLYLHGPLDATVVLSTFTTLTPLGQGGFALLTAGADLAALLPAAPGPAPAAALPGAVAYGACICGAYALWSMGVAWVAVACFSIARRAHDLPRFTISHWCVVVPNGVFAALSIQLGTALDSPFFRAFGAGWAGLVFLLWIVTFLRSLVAIWDGSIFDKPGAVPAEAKAAEVVEVVKDKFDEEGPAQIEILPSLRPSDVESVAETLWGSDRATLRNDSMV